MPFYPWNSILPGSTPPVIAGVPALYGFAQAIAAGIAAVGWGEILTAGNPSYSPVSNTVRLMDGAIEAWSTILGNPPPTLLTPLPVPLSPPPLGTGFTLRVTVGWRTVGTGMPDSETFDTTSNCNGGGFCSPTGFYPTSGAIFPVRISGTWFYRLQASDFDGSPIDINVSGGRNESLWVPTGVQSVEIFPIVGNVNNPNPQLFEFPQAFQIDPAFLPSPLPQTVPVPVVIPATPGVIPYPQELPLEIPTPYDLPSRPLPLLVPRPPARNVPDILPPAFITPEGLQIGDPSPGVQGGPTGVVTIPQQGVGTGTQTQTDPERTRDRRVPPLDVLCCDCDPCEEVDYDRIETIVFEQLDEKFPPKRPTTTRSETLGGGNGETALTATLPEFSTNLSVILQASPDLPPNKQQFGGEGGRDVVYCGWISFGFIGQPSQRIPLQYLRTSWVVPDKARYVTITATYGCTIQTVTVSYLEPAP